MVYEHDNVEGLDAAILMHPMVWKASGHVDAFSDPMIDDRASKKRYRADQLIEDHIARLEKKGKTDQAEAVHVRLVEAGKLMGVPVHDHLIIAGRGYTSLAERGLM